MPRTKTSAKVRLKGIDDLIAGSSLLFAVTYVISVVKNLQLGVSGTADFGGWGNIYALSLGLLTIAWSYYNLKRLRLVTTAALAIIATAVYIWASLHYR